MQSVIVDSADNTAIPVQALGIENESTMINRSIGSKRK